MIPKNDFLNAKNTVNQIQETGSNYNNRYAYHCIPENIFTGADFSWVALSQHNLNTGVEHYQDRNRYRHPIGIIANELGHFNQVAHLVGRLDSNRATRP